MALIDKKLTDLTEKISVPDDAFIHIVDVSDTSQSPAGSSYKARKSTISGTVKAQTGVSGTVKTNSNSVDPIVYLKSEVDALVAGKQNTLGFTPENVANKQSNLDEDLSGLKYPNVTAVKGGLSTKADVTALNLKADKSNTYTKLEVDNLIEEVDLTGKEDIANKTSSFETSSTTTYPNSKALSDGLATKIGGSGTIEFIPKFTAGGTIANSSLVDENGVVTSSGAGNRLNIMNAGGGAYGVRLESTTVGLFEAMAIKGGPSLSDGQMGLIGQRDNGEFFFFNQANAPISFNTNGVQRMQVTASGLDVTGNITASPATLANQVVVKSQLDASDAGNVKIAGDQNITGTKDFNATIGLRASIIELKSNIGSFSPSANQVLIGTNGSFFSFKSATQNSVTLSGAGLASGRVFTFTDQSGTIALTNSPVNLIAPNATALNHLVTKAQTLYTNQTITANKTVTIAEFVNNNELILSVNATSGNVTITLPTFTALQGYKVTVKKMDSSANSVLIQGVGGINIDGQPSLTVSGQYSSSTVGANLSQYIIL